MDRAALRLRSLWVSLEHPHHRQAIGPEGDCEIASPSFRGHRISYSPEKLVRCVKFTSFSRLSAVSSVKAVELQCSCKQDDDLGARCWIVSSSCLFAVWMWRASSLLMCSRESVCIGRYGISYGRESRRRRILGRVHGRAIPRNCLKRILAPLPTFETLIDPIIARAFATMRR